MTIYLIHIHQHTHTCPADPTPHVVHSRRQILAVVDGGPCRTPVTIRVGGTTTTVRCGRHEPADRQCPACRVIVTEQSITTTHLGPAATGQPPAPVGYANRPCHTCGHPLAAVLTDQGRHILCAPTAEGRAA